MNINKEFLGHAKEEERRQQLLISKFDLPCNAKEVTLYSQQTRDDYGMSFRGTLEWKIPEEKMVFNPRTGQDELELIMNPFSRDLGASPRNWITDEIRCV
jgi:hypothetical protein